MDVDLFDSYCGPAPLPETLLSRWNFDPLIFAALFALTGAWLLYGRRDRVGDAAFYGTVGLLLVAFVSPLCALASALFSARVGHHLLLIAGAAPLLAIALPSRLSAKLPLSALVILHAAIVWIWHAPQPYSLALSSHLVYWLMQLTLLGSAWMLWSNIFAPATRPGPALIALLASIIQMGLLGALLVFAPQPVFAPHWTTTFAFGLSPLEDQQLAGLLMWVPAVLPYLGVALVRLGALFAETEAGPAR